MAQENAHMTLRQDPGNGAPGAQANPIEREHYGAQTLAVEPGGVDVIPLSSRHGTARQLLWTWTSPNLEFATIAVGILGVLFFGLTFWQCFAAIVLGTVLGSVTHAILSSWGPDSGMCQMVLSRTGFGFFGNALPAGINAAVAGIGWFAVNSISGALALHALLTALPTSLCLVIVVAAMLLVAFIGHNLVHAFERYALPLLGVVFVVGAVIVFSKSHPGQAALSGGPPPLGGFLLMTGAAFGYACGWNPYASDYTRYLRPGTGRAAGTNAGLGILLSCVLLETAGAAMVSAVGKSAALDPGVYTSVMPSVLAKLTLLCIALGAIAANALNIYSGAMSFLSLGFSLPTHRARAIVAVVFGVAGLVLALAGLGNAGANYESFLLVISYWIGPWLGVVLMDRYLRRGSDITGLLTDRTFRNWAGPIAMGVGMVLSIWLFSNQQKYTGLVPTAHPKAGDLTFEVGFVIAAVLYAVLVKVLPARIGSDTAAPAEAATHG
jgi:purine-cytosine permease-like protein